MGKQQLVKRRQGRTDIQGYLYEKLIFRQNSGAGDFTLTMQPQPPQPVRPHNKAGERPPHPPRSHTSSSTSLQQGPQTAPLPPRVTDGPNSRPPLDSFMQKLLANHARERALRVVSLPRHTERRRPNPPRANATAKNSNADIKQRQQGKFSADNQTVREPPPR